MSKPREHSGEQIRERIRQLPSGTGRRYSPELLVEIGEYARDEIGEGRSRTAIADELTITLTSLERALLLVLEAAANRDELQERGLNGFVQVKQEESQPTKARIVLRSGASIDGLSFEELIRFAREL